MSSSRAADARAQAQAMLPGLAESLGTTTAVLRGRVRNQRVSRLRAMAVRRMGDAGLSYPAIGAALDRDASTVLAIDPRMMRAERDAAMVAKETDR